MPTANLTVKVHVERVGRIMNFWIGEGKHFAYSRDLTELGIPEERIPEALAMLDERDKQKAEEAH